MQEKDGTYFESLCEEEQLVEANYKAVQNVISSLKKLDNEEATDEQLLKALDKLARDKEELVASTVDLQYGRYMTKETQIRELQKKPAVDISKQVPRLREYISLVQAVDRDLFEYINLLQRLSVDMAKQVETSEKADGPFIVDNWMPNQEIQSLLNQFSDSKIVPENVRSKLEQSMDNIKMERAQYSLENRYSLQEQLIELNKQVNNWRKEWDDIEVLMFGDKAHSMKRMIQNIESLKAKLENENSPKQEDDVEMK